MEEYSVSVVIPYFNGSSYIVRALKSIVEQTLPAAEVIIVDDGSHETELTFLENLRREFDFLLVSQSNSGQSAARNVGAGVSKGKLICFLDQDDWFLPNHIKDLVGSFKESGKQPLVFGKYSRKDAFETIKYPSRHGRRRPKIAHKDHANLFKDNLMIVPSCMLVSKKVFEDLGGFDETLRGYEDDDLVIRFVLSGQELIELPWAISVWSRIPTSASHSNAMIQSQRVFFYKWQFHLQSAHQQAEAHKLFLGRFSKVATSHLLRHSLESTQLYLESQEFGREIITRSIACGFRAHEVYGLILLHFFVGLTERRTRGLAVVLVPLLNALNSLRRR